MNNTTKSIIERYLNSRNIPYAILLDGKWGTGKTWYIKNAFEKEFDKKLIYVSVNGMSSLDEISQQILYKKLYLKKKIVTDPKAKLIWGVSKQIGKALIEKYTGYDTDELKNLNVELKDFATMQDDEVLIIDDVERMKSNISMEDFLGYISTNFTEENSIKVILIADEGELLKKLGDKKDEYTRKKEKTIWQTVEYNLKIERVYDDIIKSFSKNTVQLLKKKKDYFIAIFKQYKVVNLRWILYYFQILNDIIEEEKGFFDKDKRELVLNTILILCLEYKKGKLTSRLDDPIPKYITDNSFSYETSWLADSILKFKDSLPVVELTKNEMDENKSSYRSNQFKTYHFFESLYKLVCFGLLNFNEIVKEVNSYETSVEEKRPWHLTVENLSKAITKLEDSEFDEECERLIEYINDDKYDLYYLRNIAAVYEILIQNEVKFEIQKTKLYSILTEKLKQATGERPYDMIFDRKYENLEKSSNEFRVFNDIFKEIESKIIHNDIKDGIRETLEKLEKSENLSKNEITRLLINGTDDEISEFSKLVASSRKNAEYILNIFPFDIPRQEKLEQNLINFSKQLEDDTKEMNLAKIWTKDLIKEISYKYFEYWKPAEKN